MFRFQYSMCEAAWGVLERAIMRVQRHVSARWLSNVSVAVQCRRDNAAYRSPRWED